MNTTANINLNTPGQRPLRVCFLIDDMDVGGTERHLVSLIRHLDRSQVLPHLYLLKGENLALIQELPSDCPVTTLGVSSFRRPSMWRRLAQFTRMLRHERIDVLQLYFPDSTFFGCMAGRLAGKLARKLTGAPAVVANARNVGHELTFWRRRIGRVASRLAHVTVANSNAARESVITQFKGTPSRVMVIRNGLAAGHFANREVESDGPRRVGVVANLRRVKGLDVLIRAAKDVIDEHPYSTFEIAGEGPQRPELEKLIHRLQLEDRVFLRGAIADVNDFLQNLDVGVLCSRAEGFSHALLEYMAAALPIVATRVGGNEEAIRHEREGLLISPDNSAELAAALKRLLQNHALATAMGRAAQLRVRNEFSEESQAREFEALYRQLVFADAVNPVVQRNHLQRQDAPYKGVKPSAARA